MHHLCLSKVTFDLHGSADPILIFFAPNVRYSHINAICTSLENDGGHQRL